MKKEINVFDYTADIMNALKSGVLLTTQTKEKVNTMTISWGMLGIEWGKPIFTVFVRESRFTRKQLEENGEFTINIPVGDFDKKILSFSGSKSGRDTDKIKEMGLTLEEPAVLSVPGIKELPLTLECKVVFRQEQGKNAISHENLEKFYPEAASDLPQGAGGDYHTAYYGEIVSAYMIV